MMCCVIQKWVREGESKIMGMPNIPDIKPKIELEREEVINLLLASIALEEIGLAHILNAEGEKIQKVVGDCNSSFDELLEINRSVEKTLRNVIKKEMLLQFKLEDVMELIEDKDERKRKKHCDSSHPGPKPKNY